MPTIRLLLAGRGFGDRIFSAPAGSKAMRNRRGNDACFFGPLRKSQALAVGHHEYIRSSVGSLRFPARPSAIFRAVMTIVVNSVQRASCWPFAHVLYKIDKPIWPIPPFAHTYTSAAVVGVLPVAGIPASVTHLRPSSEEGVMLTSSCKPMVLTSGVEGFFAEASARFSVPTANCPRIRSGLAAAIAKAPPHYRSIGLCVQPINHAQSAKTLPFQINKSTHKSFQNKF